MKYLIDNEELDTYFDVEVRGEYDTVGGKRMLIGVDIVEVCAVIVNGVRFARVGDGSHLLELCQKQFHPEKRPDNYRRLFEEYYAAHHCPDPAYQEAADNGRLILDNGRDVS